MVNLLKSKKFSILILTAICLFFFFFQLGSYKLIDVDEPRYAEAAREMVESSDYITPYFNYKLRFDKPVLFYWLIAGSYKIFGINEFAARFPSALLATALVFFTFIWGRIVISNTFGLISAIILATSLEIIAIGRMSITDMTLAFFICATIFSGYLGSFVDDKYKKYWWWLAYAFSGLAVLTKGPVGFGLPAIIFGIYFLLTGQLKKNLNLKYVLPGLLIFSAIIIPWYYQIIKIHGKDFVDYFFLDHNLNRFATTKLGHLKPFYFYFIVIFVGAFPWITYFIASLIKYTRQLVKNLDISELKNFKIALYQNANIKIKTLLYCFTWFLAVFIFFSAANSKLLTYILSLFPTVALITGYLWYEYFNDNKNNKSIKYSAIGFALICLVIGIGQIFFFNNILPNEVKTDTQFINIPSICLFLVVACLAIFFAIKNKKLLILSSKPILMAGVAIILLFNIMPIVYNAGQKDLINYVNFVKKMPGAKLYTYSLIKPSVVFYSQKKISHIKDHDYKHFDKVYNDSSPRFIVVRNRHLDELKQRYNYFLMNHGVKYSLISNINAKFVKGE